MYVNVTVVNGDGGTATNAHRSVASGGPAETLLSSVMGAFASIMV